jgi:nitrite reductase (NO-forming)
MDESMQRSGRGRRLLVAALAVTALVLIAVFGAAALGGTAQDATPTASSSAAAGTTPNSAATKGATTLAGTRVEVGMYDISFTPNLLTIPADAPVTIVVVNHGVTAHNFSLTGHKNPGVGNLAISVDVAPGETKTVTVNAPAGAYYFYCDVPGHEQAGMFGDLQVKPGAAVAAESATVTAPAGS